MPTRVTWLEEFLFLAATRAAMNLGVRHATRDWQALRNAADFMAEVDANRIPYINQDDVDALDEDAWAREMRWIYALPAQWGYVVYEDDVVLIHPAKTLCREVFRAVAGMAELSNRLRAIERREDQT